MNRSRRLFRRLQRASNRHLCHLAITLGREYCPQQPEHAPGWLFFGRALAEAALYDEGERALTNGLEICPPDKRPVFLAQLGHLYVLKGDYSGAERWYQQAYDEAPPEAEERLFLGEIHFKSGRLHDAERVLKDVVSQWNEELGEAWHLLGIVVAAQDRLEEASEYLQEAVSAAPDRAKFRRTLKEVQFALKHRKRGDSTF